MESERRRILKPRFLIVTPTRNSVEYLDEVLESVLSQAFDGELHYQIQNSCSSDGTLDVVRKRQDWLAGRPETAKTPTIRLSWSSEPDRSMYDGLNKGFQHLFAGLGPEADERPTWMSWINSDDRLGSSTLHT